MNPPNEKKAKFLPLAAALTAMAIGYACTDEGQGPKNLSRAPGTSDFSKSNTETSNPAVVVIPTAQSFRRVFALSDVHGMYDALIPLLESAGIIGPNLHWTAGHSLLIVVGDSIDKGPKSIEVVDFWMKLIPEAESAGGRVIHLLGNHEAEFLADPKNSKASALLDEMKSKGLTVDQLTDPSSPRGAFLRSLPVAAQVGDWLFCHAGFMEQSNLKHLAETAQPILSRGDYSNAFLIGNSSLLEMKDWWRLGSETRKQLEERLDQSGLFGVVFGHQPTALNVEGSVAISDDHRLIKIDNGMAPQAGSHPGSVLVFEAPSEMDQRQSPHVSMIRAKSPAALPVVSEVDGPAQNALND